MQTVNFYDLLFDFARTNKCDKGVYTICFVKTLKTFNLSNNMSLTIW